MSHNRSTKAQKEYAKSIVHQLSLQRLSDTEISDYLAEKGIVLARCSVNQIKKQIEKQAEKWYIDLKQSRYKYIATYKERLDSLLSYQKKLHEIIAATKKHEVKIRAISELHSIEKTIFDMWKQLPTLDIQSDQPNPKQQEQTEDKTRPPMVDDDDIYGTPVEPWDMASWFQCDHCKRWWRTKELLDYHQKKIHEHEVKNEL